MTSITDASLVCCTLLWMCHEPLIAQQHCMHWDMEPLNVEPVYDHRKSPSDVTPENIVQRQLSVGTLRPPLQVGAGEGGKYRVVLDSDEGRFGGRDRLGHGVDHFTQPEGIPGTPLADPMSISGICPMAGGLQCLTHGPSCVQVCAWPDRHVL
jgi:Alpha amylase, C-terminal all-beta domain